MNRWKKVAAITAALAVTAVGGAAWAQTADENQPTTPEAAPSADRALGGTSREGIFVPITPCRLVDTREAVGPLTNGQTRSYDVRGTGGTFAAQGGKANGCGIPSSALAVEVTATAVDASGAGFLRLFPTSEPQATFLNYPTGFNPSNTGTVALCGSNGGLCLVNADLRVKNYGGPTGLVVDVQGYYSQQMGAQVTAAGALGRNSRAASASSLGGGDFTVRFDRDVSACVYSANVGEATSGTSDGYAGIQPLAGDPNGVYVETFNPAGANTPLPFYVTVTC